MTLLSGRWPWLLLLWLMLVAVALLFRPLLPVDETRYVSVAWEMWQRGDFLVPYLNGEPYSHKPPLLFWFIHAGWSLFGVNEWWPRLVAPLVSLVNLILCWQLSHRLWPGQERVAETATWFLFGSIFWLGILTLVQFDQLLVLCSLLVLLGVLRALHGHASGFLIAGVSFGAGLLCKGPVIFLHTLPVLLLAPVWWRNAAIENWRNYYAKILACIALGIAIALAWAIPAGIEGGEAYRDAIYFHQTVGRALHAPVHNQPWWWYLALVPVALLPWSLWTPVWRSMAQGTELTRDSGVRFCLSWLLSGLLLFSLLGSKQLKYLLPLFPAAVLLFARALQQLPGNLQNVRLHSQALLLIVCGMVIGAPGLAGPFVRLPQWTSEIAWGWGLLLILSGVVVFSWRAIRWQRAILVSVALTTVLIVVFHLGVLSKARPAYDLATISARLAELQDKHIPLANVAKYHGQYHFLGRLEKPIEVFLWDAAPAWVRAHPQGYLLVYYKQDPRPLAQAEYVQAYRGGSLVLWKAQSLLDQPGWLRKLPEA